MAEVAKFSLLVIFAAMMIVVMEATDTLPYEQADLIRCIVQQNYTYVNATAFQENRDRALANLLPQLSGDYACSYENKSSRTDPVFAVAVCRKYLSTSECSECIIEAMKLVKAKCVESIGGWIHLDGCFVRYDYSSNFLSITQDNDSNGAANYCASTNDSNPTFSEKAKAISAQLVSDAAANNNYAVASSNDGSLYGVAQCWPYVTTINCQKCLAEARNLLLGCLPQQEGRGLEAGCFMRYSTYEFYSNNKMSRKSASKIVYISFGCMGGTTLLTMVCLVLFCRRITHRKDSSATDENGTEKDNFEHVLFEYEVLSDSTGNFDRNNMLGRGGFGEVYKGRLPDGTDIAVKRLNGRHESTHHVQEFLTEIKLLTSVRHRNLVRLLGCCASGNERLLVYELMPNNGLHKHLFGEPRNGLTWENRIDIIVGTARGLSYLHEDSNLRIIHRDIKCANILLDGSFHPKIGDFGMARFFPEGQTHVSTRFGGTMGYTAPEYAVHGQLTEKVDVYSYGIVVLEIVSGRKCADVTLPDPMQILLEWAWNKYVQGNVLDIVDPKLEGQYPREQALRVITIALLCTQGSWRLRPAMSKVASLLTTDLEIRVQPTQPAFVGDAGARPACPTATTMSESSTSTASAHQSAGTVTLSFSPR